GSDALADIRLAQIGFVFQSHFLLPEFSIMENVMLPMQRLGRISPAAMRKRAGDLLESFGLGAHLHKLPKQLSGGQSQRVAIARALANDPPILLADEPTGNLDSASSLNVQAILKDLAHQHGRAVAVVTHDAAFAATADRIIHIVDGHIVPTPAA
ncbi:MAG: ATP-binding cassette domain-containing protein, partial [Alphaproteobacteria bacterium]|nr:ATP-binding cassette domain-containing protein [Alphaproteobacteria bacterium]